MSATKVFDPASSTWRYVRAPLPRLNDVPSPDGPVTMSGNKLTDLANPTAGQDADTKAARDTALAALETGLRAYVLAVRDDLVGGAPGLLDTLGEIATRINTDENAATALTTALATETTNRQNADTAIQTQVTTNTNGLASEVTNRSNADTQIRTDFATADALRIPLAQKNAASGVAGLGADSRIALAQKALRVVRTVTAATTILTGDDILVAGGTTAYAVALPDAATMSGREFTVKRTSTAVTTVTSGGGTIDGATGRALNAQYQSETYVSDGTNWLVV